MSFFIELSLFYRFGRIKPFFLVSNLLLVTCVTNIVSLFIVFVLSSDEQKCIFDAVEFMDCAFSVFLRKIYILGS